MTDYPLSEPRFLDPANMQQLSRSAQDGEVTEGGVEVPAFGTTYAFKEQGTPLSVGSDVKVKISDGEIVCTPVSENDDEQATADESRDDGESAREARLVQLYENAVEFYDQHTIPVEWSAIQFSRRGEMLRGSSGTGQRSDSVYHFQFRESFEEGRLHREEEETLCDNWGKYPAQNVTLTDPETGDEFTPEITCAKCREMMTRWREDG